MKSLALSNLTKLAFQLGRLPEAESLAVRSNRIARELEYDYVIFRNSWYLREIALARSDRLAAKNLERTLLMYLSKMPDSMMEARACRDALRSPRTGGWT